MKISKVLATYGDAVTIQLSNNVWVDHCDLSGDETMGKDTYDGLVDLSHAADFVTISHTYFHNHCKPFDESHFILHIDSVNSKGNSGRPFRQERCGGHQPSPRDLCKQSLLQSKQSGTAPSFWHSAHLQQLLQRAVDGREYSHGRTSSCPELRV